MPKAINSPHSAYRPALAYHQYPHTQAQHNPYEVANWRKMYAILITHYESNGHSNVSSSSDPQLAAWLADQEKKYIFNSLTAGQVQQLALMKVSFIDSKESKLGTKCSEKKCTKFGAFEGYCHEHYYLKNSDQFSRSERDVLHNPDEEKRANSAKGKAKKKGKKSKVKRSLVPVNRGPNVIQLAAKALAEGKEVDLQHILDQKPDGDVVAVPLIPPTESQAKVSKLKYDAQEVDETAVSTDEKSITAKEDEENNGDSFDKPAAEDEKNYDTLKSSDAQNKEANSTNKSADDEVKNGDEAKSAHDKAGNKSDETIDKPAAIHADTEFDTNLSKNNSEAPATQSVDDISVPSLPEPENDSEKNDDNDRGAKSLGDEKSEAEIKQRKSDADEKHKSDGTAESAKDSANDDSNVKKPAAKANISTKTSTSTTKISAKDKKAANPVIAAAVNTMLAQYPPTKMNPAISSIIPPRQPVYYHPYAYGWPPAPTHSARSEAPSLQDQHNQNIWLKHYGSLILFYEKYGHSNVTLQFPKEFATPSLVSWVNQQRERYKKGLLNQDEMKRLDLLRFGEAKPKPGKKSKRCVNKKCTKFALFNEKCHSHYNQTSKLRKRKADPNEAIFNYFAEPLSKKSKSISGKKTQSIDAKITPVGIQFSREEKKFKLVKASKPKFPLNSTSKNKGGLWTLSEYTTEKSSNEDDDLTENNENKTIEQKKARSKTKKAIIHGVTTEEVIEKIGQYVTNLANRQNCISERRGFFYTQCTCLHYLRDKPFEVEAVSRAILEYYEKSHDEKKHYALERVRLGTQTTVDGVSERRGNFRPFSLPLDYSFVDQASLPEKDDESRKAQIGALFQHKICESSWHILHNHGPKIRETLAKYINGDTSAVIHKNVGNKKLGTKSGAREKVLEMLESLYQEHLSTCATDEIINGKKVVVLPPTMSKKMKFREFVREQGWKVEIIDTKTNKMSKVKDWPLLEGFYTNEQEAASNHGKVAGPKVNNTSFAAIWKEEYPHLKVVEGMMKGGAFLHQREHVKALLQSLWDEYAEYEDDPDETVELPFSRKALYKTWIREQGWDVKEENGRVAPYKDWELLDGFYVTEEEAATNGGKVAGDKISYPSFFNIWKDEFPRLNVAEKRKMNSTSYDSD